MNIITVAFDMYAAVEKFVTKAQRFYYLVMLFGCRCPECDGPIHMEAEGCCRCSLCGYRFDPTVAFQRCSHCGGKPVLQVRRYRCKECGSDIISTFLFKGIVFDTGYFRLKMAESRQRKKEQRQLIQQMLEECRSEPLALEAPNLNSVPGLIDALNGLTAGIEVPVPAELKGKFDLNRYQRHIESYLDAEPKDLRQIPPLIENLRLDLIWRFIAAVFLDHAGLINIYQQGRDVLVTKN
jgi:rubredoxin